MKLEALPDELILHISSFLKPEELIPWSSSSHFFQCLLSDEALWKQRFFNRFNFIPSNKHRKQQFIAATHFSKSQKSQRYDHVLYHARMALQYLLDYHLKDIPWVQYCIGYYEYHGIVLSENKDNAIAKLRQTIPYIYPACATMLELIFDGYKATQEDLTLIETTLKDKFNNGNIDAAVRLGEMFHHPKVGTKDYQSAKTWFNKALEKGFIRAYLKLGHMYLEQNNIDEALKNFKLAFNKNIFSAGNTIAWIYGTYLHNIPECKAWYKKTYQKGKLSGGVKLADFLFELANITASSREEAIRLYIQMAEKGSIEAMMKLGDIYRDPDIFSNPNEAFQWYKKALDNDHADAARMIGNLYEEELIGGDEKDSAIAYYQRAFELGDNEIIFDILQHYQKKENLSNNFFVWLFKAAEYKNTLAINYLNSNGLSDNPAAIVIKHLLEVISNVSSNKKQNEILTSLDQNQFHFIESLIDDEKLFNLFAQDIQNSLVEIRNAYRQQNELTHTSIKKKTAHSL